MGKVVAFRIKGFNTEVFNDRETCSVVRLTRPKDRMKYFLEVSTLSSGVIKVDFKFVCVLPAGDKKAGVHSFFTTGVPGVVNSFLAGDVPPFFESIFIDINLCIM